MVGYDIQLRTNKCAQVLRNTAKFILRDI